MNFRTRLNAGGVLLLDGGMGTQLQARGLPAGEHPEQFCLERPDVLRAIHEDYIQAGADIILTCTFGGSRLKLPQGIEPVAFNREMARIARAAADAAGRRVYVGGDIGPCGLFVKPLGDLHPLDLFEIYREQVRGLIAGGVDLLCIETQIDLAETRIAVAAVQAECDLPIFASMSFEQGRSLTGTTPEIFAATMTNMGVDAVGLNCGTGPEQMYPLVQQFLKCAEIPVLVEPNAGLPELIDGQSVFRLSPEPFAEKTAVFATMGARLLGGCCGTTPAHIAALRQAVDSLATIDSVPAPDTTGSICLTTRTSLVRIGKDAPLMIIGERINPTGKKDLQAELLAGEHSIALRFAAEQTALGAGVIDVNVGAPMVDEAVLLPELVQRLVMTRPEPLSLDSSSDRAIAAALPCCPGSALVNSISGEAGRMSNLGPLCRRWGAPFILLPLQGKKLPVKASERIAIIESLLEQASSLHIPRRLIMVDVLALAVASKAEAAREGLETIRWCTANGLPTTMGLSNISFGLPARELLNATFLSMAIGTGLSSCIANPSSVRLREAKAATDALLGSDTNAATFIRNYATWHPSGDASSTQGSSAGSPLSCAVTTVEEAVLQGDSEHICGLVQKELESGADAFVLVRERLIPAISEVGARYERREYFLPQLLRSAEAMQIAFAHLRPLLEKQESASTRQVIIMATVEGDIHDIGKNIVSLMLGNHGFTVIDLGKDVKANTIVRAAVEHNANLIGLSALMTTTMVRMSETVQLLRARGKQHIKVMVGGAVVTPAFAESIGAFYSSDAVDAVRCAKKLTEEGRF